jgi:nitroreductase
MRVVFMNVFDAIKKRRSIRKYKETVVEQEKLNTVLEAARLAPSAANRQPWAFIVVTDPQMKERLRSSYNEEWFIEAPVIIVACAVPEKAWHRMDGEEYWKVDVAIALQNLVLAATELGLGTCWIADFNEEAAKKVLRIPEDVRVVAMTPLGYPDEEKGPVTRRKSLNSIVHYNQW